MGIQLYIWKNALDKRNINYTTKDVLVYTGCKCSALDTVGQYCTECESNVTEHYETFAKIEGLSVTMNVTDNHFYHDANYWGACRKPLIAFVEKYKLDKHEYFEV